jgi:hypothetical protein
VRLSENCRTYFGFEWRGVYYTYTVLSFGWRLAPFIYTCFSGEVAGFLRRLGMRYVYLLDDSFGLQLDPAGRGPVGLQSAHAACYVVVSLMVGLGYFVHPVKSHLYPSLRVDWLGLTADLGLGAFEVPVGKQLAYRALIETILSHTTVHGKTLERVVGKLGSLYLAVPGTLVMLRGCYAALTSWGRSGSQYIALHSGEGLRAAAELRAWLALPFWSDGTASRWSAPSHLTVVLGTPPSPDTPTSGHFELPGLSGTFSLPPLPGRALPPSAALAGSSLLTALEASVSASGATDCCVSLLAHRAWRPRTALGSDLSQPGGEILAPRLMSLVTDSHLRVRVLDIPADTPRARWMADRGAYRLAPFYWLPLDARFGPHDTDCMASDANAQPSLFGYPLRHFTRFPEPMSAGVNLLSQSLSGDGLYCNAVFGMLTQVLHHFRLQRVAVTMVVPGWSGSLPSGAWWPLLLRHSTHRYLIALAGTPGVFIQLQEDRSWAEAGPVPWDVWAFRVDFRCSH